jgi:hypothetical protein
VTMNYILNWAGESVTISVFQPAPQAPSNEQGVGMIPLATFILQYIST